MRKNKTKIFVVMVSFIIAVLTVALFDFNLLLFGDGVWISKGFLTAVFFVLLALWIAFIAFFYVVFARAYKVEFKKDFCIQPPFEYSPALVKMLSAYGDIAPAEISAVFSYFRALKYVDISMTDDKEDRFIIKKLIDNDAITSLLPHERYIFHWFFDIMGDGTSISHAQLSEYIRTASIDFCNCYDEWGGLIQSDVEESGFFFKYEKIRKAGKAIGILFMIAGTTAAYLSDKTVFFAFFLLGVILYSYCKNLSKRTLPGQRHFEKWMAYKRYLRAGVLNSGLDIEKIEKLRAEFHYVTVFGFAKQARMELDSHLDNCPHCTEAEEFEKELDVYECIAGSVSDCVDNK